MSFVKILVNKTKVFINIEKAEGALTPVDRVEDYYFKRDDQFEVFGAIGGKARTAYALSKNSKGLITAGVRQSPQILIVSKIAKGLGLPFIAHTIKGELTPELIESKENGAIIISHNDTWHNSVIISRAKKDAIEKGYKEIPFGMENWEAVYQTAYQVKNIPDDVKRIVIPVGSGMSCSGVLWGLKYFNRNIKVVGIVVGAEPINRLNKYAPNDWRSTLTLIKSKENYHTYIEDNTVCGITVDPIYEAKCIPYLRKGDLFWLVGIRSR